MNWVGFTTLVMREVGRFFSVYRQTVLPGVITTALYIVIFGFTLEQRISEIQGVPYTLFILPGLIMMNTLNNATANTSSSMLQMKLLQQLPDLLTAPLSGFEISIAYIIGGTVRGDGKWDPSATSWNAFNSNARKRPPGYFGVHIFSFLGILKYGSFAWATSRKLGPVGHDAKFLFDPFKFSWWNILFNKDVA